MVFSDYQTIYFSILTPMSVCGILLNAFLLCVWNMERYKFNRLILKTIAGLHIVYLGVYHLWFNVSKFDMTGKDTLAFSVFSIREYVSVLYTFLSIMQYFYSADLIHYHAQPLLVQKTRITTGLVLLGLYSMCIRFFILFVEKRITSKDQRVILSAIFRVFMYYGPQLASLYFVVRMFFNIRHHKQLIGSGGLELALSRYFLKQPGPAGINTTAMLKTKVRSAVTQLMSAMSVTSSPIPNKLSIAPKILSCHTYKQLKNNLKLELYMTKAVMLVILPAAVIFLIGFSVEIILWQVDVDDIDIFYATFDCLQFLNTICLPLLLIIMLPSFRHKVQRRMALLLTGQRVEVKKCTVTSAKRSHQSTTSGSTGSSSSTPSETDYGTSEHAIHQPNIGTTSSTADPGAQIKKT